MSVIDSYCYLQCFAAGAEIGPHKNDHSYQFIVSKLGFDFVENVKSKIYYLNKNYNNFVYCYFE